MISAQHHSESNPSPGHTFVLNMCMGTHGYLPISKTKGCIHAPWSTVLRSTKKLRDTGGRTGAGLLYSSETKNGQECCENYSRQTTTTPDKQRLLTTNEVSSKQCVCVNSS